MMTITALTGPLAEETCQLLDGKESAIEFLTSTFLLHGDDWALDFSRATTEEALEWSLANVVCKAKLAEQIGRPMFFNGREFTGYEEFLDAISSSGGLAVACRDDKEGFGVETVAFPTPEPR